MKVVKEVLVDLEAERALVLLEEEVEEEEVSDKEMIMLL